MIKYSLGAFFVLLGLLTIITGDGPRGIVHLDYTQRAITGGGLMLAGGYIMYLCRKL